MKVFLFGNISGYGNTKGTLLELKTKAEIIQADFYYLDIYKNSVEEIQKQGEEILKLGDQILLCADEDGTNKYGSTATIIFGTGFRMPLVLIIGEENETIACREFTTSAADFADWIETNIKTAYPECVEENLAVRTDTLYMYEGMSRRFPLKSSGGSVLYESSDEAVAEINEDGTITAKKPGTVTLKAFYGSKAGTVTLHVLEEEDPYYTDNEWEVLKLVNEARLENGKEPISMMQDMQKAAHVRAKEQLLLYSHTRPDESSYSTVLSEAGLKGGSSGENIASGYGTPEHVMEGWMESTKHRANILNSGYTHIGIGEESRKWVQVFLECGYSQTVTGLVKTGQTHLEAGEDLSSLDYYITVECPRCGEAVIPVVDGMCTGFDSSKTETQQVTVKLGNWSETFQVTVDAAKKPVTKIQLSKSSLSLETGAESKLTASIVPSDADDKRIQWSSSNPSVASVDANGTVRAVAQGQADIYAAAMDGSGVRSSACHVTVEDPVQAVTIRLDKKALNLREGTTEKLTVSLYPYDADKTAVEWSSSNPDAASVSADGLVTAKNPEQL